MKTLFPASPLAIPPLPSAPTLTWPIPGSKSITNRALILAALADGETVLQGVLHSDDTRHMRQALAQLGVGIEDRDATTLVVHGGRARLRAPTAPLFVGNSGTTVRFLAALCCHVPGPVTLVGDDAMAVRPIADLVEGLRQVGVRIECPTGCPPLTIHGGRLPGGRIKMRGDRSSQYFSAVLLAGCLADDDIHVEVQGSLVSRPYLDITRHLVAAFGGKIEAEGQGFHVHRAPRYQGLTYAIEPDASSASYAFAAAVATGGRVTVPHLGTNALQGDYAFVDLLGQVGAHVEKSATATTVTGVGPLRGIDVDMHHISDTVMTLAALAPLCGGPTRIRNIANIRIKETDRLAATVAELQRLGQQVSHGDDWLQIDPRPIVPAVVKSYKDHRMAMSFAILGLARPGISIEDPACVSKTYPDFWQDLAACYRAVGAPEPF